uniref:Dolichyl-phosphate-mannose--protein mannosyltransferase 2 (Protein mannosyltransferase 2) (EC) n=1 Tax=Ganoderma boninense TaxID=34458 RepID=A0A5K1K651_9APHY|nr:Dolichyl-phosphate-mannose--protein mannosyltransferase 2 (Protein mannosyltransferase 2) (EC [Ganoderma boninense]
MTDPFSPNRFIHEVEPSSSTGARPGVGLGGLRPTQSRRKEGHTVDGGLGGVSDLGPTPSHPIPRSRAAAQPQFHPTGMGPTHSDHPSRSSSPRSIAVLSGVVISILFFYLSRIWNYPSLENLPSIDPAVKAYIDRAINRALRDPVGRRDFALLADGAIVLAELTKLITPKGTVDLPSNSFPDMALNDDM